MGHARTARGECPECGAPIENVRVTCPVCSYEYKESDYTKPDAGHKWTAGAQIDERGNEIIEEPETAASDA